YTGFSDVQSARPANKSNRRSIMPPSTRCNAGPHRSFDATRDGDAEVHGPCGRMPRQCVPDQEFGRLAAHGLQRFNVAVTGTRLTRRAAEGTEALWRPVARRRLPRTQQPAEWPRENAQWFGFTLRFVSHRVRWRRRLPFSPPAGRLGPP